MGAAAAAGLLLAAAGPAHAATTQSYATPGTYTFTVPAGVSQVRAVLTGGGGAGSLAWFHQVPGSGGGGGATAACTLLVRPGDTLTVTVGTGGTSRHLPRDIRHGTHSTIGHSGGGASAEGGRGGLSNKSTAASWGGPGGGKDATWCSGTDARLNFGHPGTNGRSSDAAPGGAPGAGVHGACPAGAGAGGAGMPTHWTPYSQVGVGHEGSAVGDQIGLPGGQDGLTRGLAGSPTFAMRGPCRRGRRVS
ncbi:hypothetical protein GCM10022224_094630 [Nonomuraea antimicrobica]|uniref:Glycine-rich domain-containing protein n=1 Tax=Nonomuraea antimicrobica TaxID=561173 RepID=A0ABP7E493_9ACTN